MTLNTASEVVSSFSIKTTWIFESSFNEPHDLIRPKVTLKWRHFTGSHLEVAVEGQKLESLVRMTSYNAVGRRRRQSRDRKWPHVTTCDRKWPGNDVIWPQVAWKWLYKVENSIVCFVWPGTSIWLNMMKQFIGADVMRIQSVRTAK